MFYTENPLDRQDHMRSDADALLQFWEHPATCVIPIWQGKVLVDNSKDRLRAVRLGRRSLGENLRYKTPICVVPAPYLKQTTALTLYMRVHLISGNPVQNTVRIAASLPNSAMVVM